MPGGGSAAKAKVAALQPLVSASGVNAKAAWTLLRNLSQADQVDASDRTGNGYNLNTGNTAYVPDLIPGQQAYVPSVGYPTNAVGCATTGAAGTGAIIYGAASYTCRVLRLEQTTSALVSWVYHCGHYNEAPTSLAVIDSHPSGPGNKICAYWQAPAGTDQLTMSNFVMPCDGKWHFLSVARDASGAVEFGLDGVYQTVAFAACPTPGSGPLARSTVAGCQATIPAGSYHNGPVVDSVLWDGKLTQADAEVLRKIAMGL